MKMILDTSMCLWGTITGVGRNQQNFQAIDCYNYPGMQIRNRKSVVLNGETLAIVAHIVQLIVNWFEAKSMFRQIGN